MRRFVPLLLALAVPLTARGAEPADVFADVTRRSDVTYATVGAETLRFDLAAPKAGGPYPCVVCLHGGAWKSGSRKDLSRPVSWIEWGVPGKSLIEILAARGYVAVSVGYRLAPRDKFPAQIQDVRTAVRYLRANAKALNIDPGRIAVLGLSAGGHLAALAGTADKDPALDGDLYPEQSSRVSCVVDFFGPTDLTLYAETPGIEKAFFAPLMGGLSKDKPALYKLASPLAHVSKDDPPFLIVHGTADILVPILHSERLYKKLTDAGVKAEFLPVKGKGHGWGGEEAARTVDATCRFLDEHLRGK